MTNEHDELWADRTRLFARARGSDGRAALVARGSRLLSLATHARVSAATRDQRPPEVTALLEATSRSAGATLYVTHRPDGDALEMASRAGIARVVLVADVPITMSTVSEWKHAGMRVEWSAAASDASEQVASRPGRRAEIVETVRRALSRVAGVGRSAPAVHSTETPRLRVPRASNGQ